MKNVSTIEQQQSGIGLTPGKGIYPNTVEAEARSIALRLEGRARSSLSRVEMENGGVQVDVAGSWRSGGAIQ